MEITKLEVEISEETITPLKTPIHRASIQEVRRRNGHHHQDGQRQENDQKVNGLFNATWSGFHITLTIRA